MKQEVERILARMNRLAEETKFHPSEDYIEEWEAHYDALRALSYPHEWIVERADCYEM